MNPLAVELNDQLKSKAPIVFGLLSQKGRESYFPKSGILAQSMQAKGTAINATIGIAVEDNLVPVHFSFLEELVKLDPKKVFPYAGCTGVPAMRMKWKEMQLEKNPLLKGKKTSLPVVTAALSHGLNLASYLFMDAGDTVIIPDMYWGNYNMLVKERCDVNFDMYPFYEGDGMNLEGLEDRLTKGETGKKFIAMNFPNNPTGYTPTKDEMKELARIIKTGAERGNKIVVICDDAYFGLVYEDNVDTQSIFAHIADIHENVLAVKIDGATKEDYVWGFRVGFITYNSKGLDEDAYAMLEDKTAGGIRGTISSAPHISQSLLLEAYDHADYKKEKTEKFELLASRYEKVKEILEQNMERYSEYFSPLPFNSGYFMCVALKEGLDGDKVRKTLIENYSTGTIFIRGVIRLAYSAVAKDKIEILFENLYLACKENS